MVTRSRLARTDPRRPGGLGARALVGLGALLAATASVGCHHDREVVVFCAASLQPVLADTAAAFGRDHPGIRIRIEPSGSLVAARKVTELGMRADLIAVADADLIERMLIPGQSQFDIEFAANEIVLAHRDHSRYTDQVTGANWPEILLRDGVRLGCVDPNTAPIGYRTRFVWQLAGLAATGSEPGSERDLDRALSAHCAAEHVVPDENELVSLLEARAIDYAFLYRSTAETHHLKTTLLDPAINLSRRELAGHYAEAEVDVAITTTPGGGGVQHLHGAPITYGITLLDGARQRAAAIEFLAFLLGSTGHRELEQKGFLPLAPAPAHHIEAVPSALRQFLVAAP